MATLQQGNFTGVLDEVVTGVMYDAAFEGAPVAPALYTMRAAIGRRERFQSVASLGNFQLKPETQAASEGEIVEQFSKTFTPRAFALQVPFSRELAEDEDWGFIARLAQNLGQAYLNTIESDGGEIFRKARSTTLCEDSLSLVNSAHVNADSGNSQSNQGNSTLNMTGVKTIRTAMRKIKNYSGNGFSKLRPDTLLVPLDLEEAAWEVVRSLGRPDSANNANNMYNGMFNLLVWDELSDSTTEWFMIDSMKMAENLLWLWRTPFESFGDGDLFTGVRKIGGYYRESHGCLDWRWIYSGKA